ncbi:MAG: cytochrome c [Xanthomonadales bacterium]|nr:cytochrome c [Xanthomonadales bacterium]ODU95207.1 MAG: cytochrome C [Rhodanobacter sp. SCN 66-43]OJY83426.1 MAG: cytochrome C [Xanthomonadales bacterium 66-474]
MIRSVLSVVLLAGFACFATTAFAKGDPARGKLEVYSCHGCHGIRGYMSVYPEYHVPKIAGQNEQYLIDALNEYKSGDRGFPTMHAQANSLTEQQIEDIAAYLSSLAPKQKQ